MINPATAKAAAAVTATTIDVVSKAASVLSNMQPGSLVEYTQATRVEPLVLLDDSLRYEPFIGDCLQLATSVFSGYYLQAVALLANVGRVNVLGTLDRLNPSRSVAFNAGQAALGSGKLLAMESYQDGLPWAQGTTMAPGLEAQTDTVDASAGVTGATFGKDTISRVEEASNLVTGKALEVVLQDGDAKITVPVIVRLAVLAVDPSTMAHTLALGEGQLSWKERWHGFRSGRLRFWKDLVLMQDLVELHRKNLLRDKSGFYQETLKRRQNNGTAALFSGGKGSIAGDSSILILSSQTQTAAERELTQQFRSPKTRDDVFKKTGAMLMFIINKEWDTLTIYHRGIAVPTELTLKELKTAARGNGPDVGEILKAYQLGNSPSL